MASKLYVGGLAYSTTSEGLREFFAQSGNVLSATVITDRFSGQSRGVGFVEMGTAEEAQNAISQLNGRELDGRRITVEVRLIATKGEYASWRATRATGDFDLRTFSIRAYPVEKVPEMRPGMSAYVDWQQRQ